MHIVGTAGHVDHGKSTLVRALTGTDPDRWIEERLRGMTLDLGFAHLRFPDGVEAGIIDVPGHERFLHNMLAGAAGMEVLLMVIAANEGPKPQTAEHLAILRYLNVKRTIVVLSKADTVDAEELAFAQELVREELTGTIGDGAEIVPVSTLTGYGLDRLRAAIHAALCALPPRAPEAPAYLPIDRAFALAGHGTIVTGTLMQGRVSAGDALTLFPLGRDVRARTLQVFGEKRTSAEGGTRVALNLPGIEADAIARGAVLASAQFDMRTQAAVAFRPLAVALPLLRRRTPIRVYLGSAEIFGTLVFERVPDDEQSVAAQLFLREPTVVLPGAAFVVRRLSPKTLLGGGTIAPTGTDAHVERGDSPDVAAIVAALDAVGPSGAGAASLGAASNVREDAAVRILERLVDEGRAVRLHKPAAFASATVVNELVGHVLECLQEGERQTPWRAGMTTLALARALRIAEPTLVRVLALAGEDGRLASRSGYFTTSAFVPTLEPAQRAFFDRTFAPDPNARYAPTSVRDVDLAMRSSDIVGIAQSYETLLISGALVRIADAVYRDVQLREARTMLEAALRRDKSITMAAFRDLLGTSRKSAVPLLEWFDTTGVTVRAGDVRFLSTQSRTPRTGE